MTELEEYFLYKCHKGLLERGLANQNNYVSRLKYETDTIIQMGFPGYFLTVQDILAHARSKGILCGPGRGSVAGALTAYVMRITNLDPLRWGLIFERFLNPDRISMPDVDMDFPEDRRHEVIDYVKQKYGWDKVANIGTFGQMKAKGAVRAAARTLGLPEIGDRLSKYLLEPIHGKPQPISTSLEKVKELQKLHGDDIKVIKWAQKIENIFSSVGVHASGIVISNESLLDTVPLFLGKSGEQTTQWDMNRIEDYGLIKFDILGLKTLTKIKTCIDFIKERHGIDIDIDNLDLDDDSTYAMLRDGHTPGIFQMETSSGMKDLLVRIRPTSLEDITALVAIFRPGPLESDYKDVYLAVRAGTMEPQYLVPELEPILKPTGGWMIYQEQVLRIASEICGMTKAEADLLRRAIGKKKEKEIALYEGKFKDGWRKAELSSDTGNTIWDQIKAFAEYAFNKSHAAAYALVAYQTAWLKTHYPIEFMCANMICDINNRDQIIKYIGECKRLGIDILPPHVNLAAESFTIEDNKKIRFGLGPIKNLGKGPVKLITQERKANGPFKDFTDFCNRVDLSTINRLKIESLIKAGAFDGLGPNRASLLNAVDQYWEYKKSKKSYDSKFETYKKKLAEYEARLAEIEQIKVEGSNTKVPKPKKVPTAPNTLCNPQIIEVSELELTEKMQFEHELLGFFVSNHPLDRFQDTIQYQQISTIDLIKTNENKAEVEVAAVISSLSTITTKKKANMGFLHLEDKTGQIEAVVFPREYEQYKDLMKVAAPLKFFGTLEKIENEEESVCKLIVKTIGILKEIKKRPVIKEVVQPLKISIPSDKLIATADILETYKGIDRDIELLVTMLDGSTAKFSKGIKVSDIEALKEELGQKIYE